MLYTEQGRATVGPGSYASRGSKSEELGKLKKLKGESTRAIWCQRKKEKTTSNGSENLTIKFQGGIGWQVACPLSDLSNCYSFFPLKAMLEIHPEFWVHA